MAKDFYLKSARKQFDALRAARADLLSQLEAHRQAGDAQGAAETVQGLADVAASEQNLTALVQQYAASQRPQPDFTTPAERAAPPPERMDWNDVVELTRTSKYCKDIQPNDPNLIAGYQEAMRRRAQGR